ncbi:GNAT family N-acetyltransferase [Nesterenkonia ebinurensis]|uniref:GNAT family N-acetyltransferase n=1 Tax=Nesterenkonia ebinurensis TaxID=2608252 RepID=UPI0037CA662F
MPAPGDSGFTTEAAQALAGHARNAELKSLVAVTRSANTAAQAVARRLCMIP